MALATTAPMKQMKTILLTLIEGGAHLDFRSKDGQTAMHKAAIEGNVGAIEVSRCLYLLLRGYFVF